MDGREEGLAPQGPLFVVWPRKELERAAALSQVGLRAKEKGHCTQGANDDPARLPLAGTFGLCRQRRD